MWSVFLVSTVLGFVACVPLGDQLFANFSTAPLSTEDQPSLEQLVRPRAALPANFKRLYVSQIGQIVLNTKPATGHWIEIVGSPLTSEQALYQAAKTVNKMLAHAPVYIFNNIANRNEASVAIFTDTEKITIFPEYSSFSDTPACQGRCDGSCSYTCYGDGSKYMGIVASSGHLSVTIAYVIEDNVLCTELNPFQFNMLVTYFADIVKAFGFSDTEKSQLTAAYNNAKANRLWTLSSQVMKSESRYFMQGTTAFFLISLDSDTDGMTECPGHACSTEAEVQLNIHNHDPQLYDLLSHVYFNGNPVSPSGVTICPE